MLAWLLKQAQAKNLRKQAKGTALPANSEVQQVALVRGVVNATCVECIELGMVMTGFGVKEQITLVFEADIPTETGQGVRLGRTYNCTLYKKSHLFRFFGGHSG